MFDDYPVKYRADSEIEKVADGVRRRLFGPVLPSRRLLEGLHRFSGLRIIPLPDEELGRYDAYVSVNPKRIFCKQTVYDGMRSGSAAASGILAHEVGHYVLHPAKEIRFLATDGNEAPFNIHPNESAERQAWLFADAFQMPLWSIGQVETVEHLANLCNVPLERAERRWQQHRQKTSTTLQVTGRGEDEIAWELAKQIPGEDPAMFRQAGIYRIANAEINMMSQCGWFVRDGQAVAWMTLDHQWC